MYQALYRKWRPQIFDDVVGQSHITQTLKKQVQKDRLSHAYLFTGTRGTGKTTCAKILAKAVNCQNPVEGNPCRQCSACVGIDTGAILDVVELDAASNNGVEQIRALRDEAIYAPAAVRKRVYIVDEVHMLSISAFNALLKILEEPPQHLMFILATTELHKVPATILSRCQRFSFKRILPADIQNRLLYIAQQEEIDLTQDGAALLARLADGALRDALSLLDQCMVSGRQVNRDTILETLGLAGNLKTANIMNAIAQGDTQSALMQLQQLYENGKDVSAVLAELASLTRDLLIQKTAPKGGEALLTGGYDPETMHLLGRRFTPQRLLQMLTRLQAAQAGMRLSANRRTDAELCLIQLSEVELDPTVGALSARIAQMEGKLAGMRAIPEAMELPRPASEEKNAVPASVMEEFPEKQEKGALPAQTVPPVEENLPPWDREVSSEEAPPADMQEMVSPPEPVPDQEEAVPVPLEERPPDRQTVPEPPLSADAGVDRVFWPRLAGTLRPAVGQGAYVILSNPNMTEGILEGSVLTLYLNDSFAQQVVDKLKVREAVAQAASAVRGHSIQVKIQEGYAPESAAPAPTADPFEELLAFGRKNNMTID